jgi:hypothetical protein
MNETNDLLRGRGFSPSDLVKQTKDNIGFNQYLENQGVDIDGLPGAAVGFAGDVVLDPTTYLSFGATSAGKSGVKEIAEELAEKAAQGSISHQVAKEAVDALGRSGTAATLGRFPEAAKAVGWEGGVRVVAPGYGSVGRITRLSKLLDRTAYGKAVRDANKVLWKSGEKGIATAELIAKPFQAVRNLRTAQAVRKALSRSGRATNDLFSAASTAEQRWHAVNDLARRGHERMGELSFAQTHNEEMKGLLTDIKRHDLDDEIVRLAERGMDDPSLQAVLADPEKARILERYRQFMDNTADAINEAAGSEVISKIERYSPGVLEQKFREQFGDVIQRTRQERGGKVFTQEKRKWRVGELLEGVDAEGNRISQPIVEPAQAGGRGVRDQVQDFYKNLYGENYTPIFNGKASQVLPVYLNAMSRLAGKEEGAKFLRHAGVGKSLTDIIEDQPDIAERVLQRASLDGDYDFTDLSVDAAMGRQVKNQSRLDWLRQRVVGGNTDKKLFREAKVRELADDLYRQADELESRSREVFEAGDVQTSYDYFTYAQARRIEADSRVAFAKDMKDGLPQLGWGAAKISDKDLEAALKLMDENVGQFFDPVRFGGNTVIEQDLLDMMSDYAKVNDPQAMRGFLKYYDAGVAYLKRQQLASPGFLVRNYMGGKFMHYIDGIELGAEHRFLEMKRAAKSGDWAKVNKLDREAWDAWEASGLFHTGQVAAEYDRNLLNKLSWKPWDKDFALYRKVADGNDWVEDRLRGTHFTDAYKQGIAKGMDAEDAARNAYQRVVKYHFDYDDLTEIERKVIRRFIPFYTWSRKAIPVMLQDMIRKPGKINNYLAAKDNLERDVPIDEFTPQWLLEGGAWRLPVGSGDGAGQSMWMPDLPINAIDKYIAGSPGDSVRDSLSQLSPILKTPLEAWKGKQFFKDIPLSDDQKELPLPYKLIPGLEQALSAAGIAHKSADGHMVVKDRYLYFLDQFVPLLGRARRLAPSEQKFQQRMLASWLSFMGLGIRANTKAEQEKEIWRRFYAGKNSLDSAQELGYAEGVDLPYIDPADRASLPDWVLENTVPKWKSDDPEIAAENQEF